ncbi:MAG: glycosyltransferase family 4 protein [Victivallales bacterium]|nr:glycosyltransferase family 4 protein [Victivallales bacterium]
MRLAIVCGIYPPEGSGGIETYTRDMAEALVAAGHEVVVLSRTKGEDQCEELAGVEVHRYRRRELPKGERFLPGLWWSRFLAQELDRHHREKPLTAVEFPNWEGVGYWYARRKASRRVPTITWVHTPFFESLELKPHLRKQVGSRFTCWLEKRAILASDHLVCSTRAHRQMVAGIFGFDPERAHVMPLGTSLPTADEVAAIPPAPPDAPIRVLYASRLEVRKGTQTLLDAVPDVASEFPDVEFLVAGKDRPEAPGGQLFADYFRTTYAPFTDRVKFLGFVSDAELKRLYQQCDVFAVPSNYESFGLVFIEGMSWGKPVIGGRAGGMPEVIADGKTGFLVDPGDVAGFAAALGQLCRDQGLRTRMGQAARQHTVENFDRSCMAANMADFVDRVVLARG